MEGYWYSDYVDMENELEVKNDISNDPKIRMVRKQLNKVYAEAVEANTKLILLAST